jgi:hypothetical protein
MVRPLPLNLAISGPTPTPTRASDSQLQGVPAGARRAMCPSGDCPSPPTARRAPPEEVAPAASCGVGAGVRVMVRAWVRSISVPFARLFLACPPRLPSSLARLACSPLTGPPLAAPLTCGAALHRIQKPGAASCASQSHDRECSSPPVPSPPSLRPDECTPDPYPAESPRHPRQQAASPPPDSVWRA